MRNVRYWLTIGPPVALLLTIGILELIEVARVGPPIRLGTTVVPSVLGALSIVAGLALLFRTRIGWLLAMSIIGWELIVLLVAWWTGEPRFLGLGLASIMRVPRHVSRDARPAPTWLVDDRSRDADDGAGRGARPRADASDLELLRHYEPILHFTKGESFYPMSVADYLAEAALIRRQTGQERTPRRIRGS